MKEIKLTKGQVALVDDEDFEWLNQWKWQAIKGTMTWYAHRKHYVKGKYHTHQMHREILGILNNSTLLCDHINCNGLDNRRSNLRTCNKKQNCCNRRPSKNKTSQYKGVGWFKTSKIWRTYIKNNNKNIHLGYFKNEIEAAKAYDQKAKELFGEFAYLNFKE